MWVLWYYTHSTYLFVIILRVRNMVNITYLDMFFLWENVNENNNHYQQ